ncbi:flagellar biosynthesis protein FlhF [Tissierella sp. MB52-C2]|uniref:flagellar biosynthesis protein FlhF n=1 Tax=Tissierella sp. MB52-C2 TaxID=3070999 RepID=UPI00280B57C4|nr:flagellar biosynthesis protein FlhF [Tissierella sp. MB52-C2]WMM26604.1 flagellar biosynthesis protein FlhF [Tissierella sp. MB52-C2]
MKIKKYIGQTTHEAMLKLKMELGPDAVVLSTKTIRAKGLFGFLKKPLIEITAGFEEKNLLSKSTVHPYEKELGNINRELTQLKNMMTSISISQMREEKDRLPPILKEFYDIMVKNGVNSEIATDILEKNQKQINLEEKDKDTIRKLLKFNLVEILGSPKPTTIDDSQKIVFFVGPTGVGKTTTLAKVAASFVLEDKHKLGLITSDTYRIAAVEQLKVYSDILQLPLEVAYNKVDMEKALHKFKDKDIIFIDTAGRNHNDIEQIQELQQIIDTTHVKDIFLLINANIDCKVLKNLIEKYSFLDNYRLIITKVDEAENYGNILNIRYITNKELSYLTIGQNVPDDIQMVDVDHIAEKIIGENNNE